MLNQTAVLMSTIPKLPAVLCDADKQHSNVHTEW